MSDYLSILARRAISAPALRPRPRSRFEKGPGVDPAPPVEAAPADPQPMAAPPAAMAAQHPASMDRPSVHAAPTPVPAPPSPAMPAAAIAPLATPREGGQLPGAVPASPAPTILRMEAPPELARPAPVALAGAAAARVDTPRASDPLPPVASAPPPAQREIVRHPRPALETVGRLQVSAPVPGAAPPGDAGQGGGRRPAGAALAPPAAIEIHIGRIEVQAAGEPPARAPAPRPVQAPATTSLDDYLRERNGRGGRS
jgi:hypothetical protein